MISSIARVCSVSAAFLDKKQVVVITKLFAKKTADLNVLALTIKIDLKGLRMEFN